jgi:hypothetical protein
MAKRAKSGVEHKGGAVISNTERTIQTWADDLGRILGTARAKANSWLNQRQEIAKHLMGIRDTATHLLAQLGNDTRRAANRVAVAALSTSVTPVRKRRRMSKAARAKIAAAQRARWAKVKSGVTVR